MKHKALVLIEGAIFAMILLVAASIPLIFLNLTTEFYEIPKLAFLVISTVILLGLWMLSWVLKGKVIITRTPLDIPLLIFAFVVLISTFFSETRYISIYGNLPRVHGSAVSWITYILLFFITVSHLKKASQITTLLYVLCVSASAVSIVTLLSYFNVFLPLDFARSINFTPTGSPFSTTALLVLLTPVPFLSLIGSSKLFPTPIAIFIAGLFGATVVLTGSTAGVIALVISLALSFFIANPHQIIKRLVLILVPLAFTAMFFILTYAPIPGNPLKAMQTAFPKEVQLPFEISWKVATGVLRDAPFIGTGPGTFLFNFTNFKPPEFNRLRFWNFSFDTAYNEFLQIVATLGIAGFIALLILCIVIVMNSRKVLFLHPHDSAGGSQQLESTLAVSSLLIIVLLSIHATTLVSLVISVLVLAAFMASQKAVRENLVEFSLSQKSASENKQFDLLPAIFFVLFLIFASFIMLNTFNTIAADYYHRQALSLASENGSLTYKHLQTAESLNPYADLYRIDLAQTNFALANAIAVQKSPSQTLPQGSMTDQDKNTIQTLLAQAINEGKAAAALNPRSARNWEVLGSIYRNISGVAENSSAFALDAYGRAIQQDPLNPSLRLSVGGIYYSAKNYDLAVRFFSDAVSLKPDYANAYYNLAIALREKGDLQNAKVVAEQMLSFLQKDTADYKTAAALLEDLNSRIASGGGTTTGQPAPAGQTNSALTNTGLSGVNVNLNNPPKAATPAAIRNDSKGTFPQTTPSPR
jgi:tetratricopeptide (TPR) repeat protein/O-antigen ligase